MSCQPWQNLSDAIVKPVKGKNTPDLGPVAVMVSSQVDLDFLRGSIGLKENKARKLFMSRLYIGDHTSGDISVVGPFIGAPYSTMLLEMLIAWGAEKIMFFGWCGAISRDVKIGDIIIPNGAIIDEGTSRHYHQGDDAISRPSSYILENIKEAIKKAGLDFHEGIVWSTDAIYRETCEKVKHFQEKDVLAVEMELSALFTVGRFRNVQIGGILVVSDELSTLTWKPGFKEQRFKESRISVVEMIKEIKLPL